MTNPGYAYTGPASVADDIVQPDRATRDSAVVVSHLHGRFFEATYRLNSIAVGFNGTVLLTGGSQQIGGGSTTKPIIYIYNPQWSPVNLVPRIASLNAAVTAATTTGIGVFVWTVATNQRITTPGAQSINLACLVNVSSSSAQAAGNFGWPFSGGTALNGSSVVSTVLFQASALAAGSYGNFSFAGTAVGPQPVSFTSSDNFDGSLILPPGALLGLLDTTQGVALTGVASLIWEEVPL